MGVLDFIKVIIIGIVEGITEWLPISSTGHMILVNEWIKLDVSAEFWEFFLTIIQLGAIMAVVVLFFDKLNPLSFKKSKVEKKQTWSIWFKVVVGVVPAAVIGLLFDEWMYTHLYNYITVALMLVLYGVFFIIIENRNKGKVSNVNSFNTLTYRTAFFIGLFQVLALVPGTSRSGATILGAMILGTSRFIAAEFSFFLSIPVMFGASLVKLLDFGFQFTNTEITILIVGIITAFGISVLAIKFLLGYIKRNDFKLFGWYRIVLGVVVILYFLFS